jgi:D-hydroxyproline dehydrogenase subunit gamma
MFHKPPEAVRQTVTVLVEGVPVSLNAGESAAAAALLAGLAFTRNSAIGGEPRVPYCMMGVCFECLMVIDGIASRQACLVPVQEGMRIERQNGRRGLSS